MVVGAEEPGRAQLDQDLTRTGFSRTQTLDEIYVSYWVPTWPVSS